MTKKLSTKEIFQLNQGRKAPRDFAESLLWIHDMRSLHNVGSIFRTADAFGIKGLILSGYTPQPPRAEISKTALGADEYVHWIYFSNIDQVLDYLREENYILVGLEQTTASIPIYDLRLKKNDKVCLVLGHEISGIDDEIMQFVHKFVEIPQYGRKHSFNVSVSAGIALSFLHENYRIVNEPEV